MITYSYDLDTMEEAFVVAIKVDLTFKMLANVKARCSNCGWYEHCDYQCPLESQHVRTELSEDVDDLKVVEDVHISSKTASIIEDISVSFDTSIIEEGHASYEDTSEVAEAIVDSGTPLDVVAELMY